MVVVVCGLEFIPVVVAVLGEKGKGKAVVIVIDDDVKGVESSLMSCHCSTVCIHSLVSYFILSLLEREIQVSSSGGGGSGSRMDGGHASASAL